MTNTPAVGSLWQRGGWIKSVDEVDYAVIVCNYHRVQGFRRTRWSMTRFSVMSRATWARWARHATEIDVMPLD